MNLPQGSKIFTEAMTDNLWKMAQTPYNVNLPQMPIQPKNTASNNTQDAKSISIDIGDIQMYGVNDPQEFAQQLKYAMQRDKGVQDVIGDLTLGKALGKNPMNRFTR